LLHGFHDLDPCFLLVVILTLTFCILQQLNACQAREEVAAAQLGALHRKLLQEQEEQDCLRAATMKLVAATAELRELAGSAK
jgi:hypothetical protein